MLSPQTQGVVEKVIILLVMSNWPSRPWNLPSFSFADLSKPLQEMHATTLSYSHDDQDYSEECLTRLALSVPCERRESCHTTGPKARGYNERCLKGLQRRLEV